MRVVYIYTFTLYCLHSGHSLLFIAYHTRRYAEFEYTIYSVLAIENVTSSCIVQEGQVYFRNEGFRNNKITTKKNTYIYYIVRRATLHISFFSLSCVEVPVHHS